MLTAWVCCCFHAHPSWQGSAASTVHGHWAVFPLLWSAVSFGLSSSVHTGRDDERHRRGEIKRNGWSEIQRQVQAFPGRHTTVKWIKSSHLGTKTPLFGLLWTLGHFSASVYVCVLTCVWYSGQKHWDHAETVFPPAFMQHWLLLLIVSVLQQEGDDSRKTLQNTERFPDTHRHTCTHRHTS